MRTAETKEQTAVIFEAPGEASRGAVFAYLAIGRAVYVVEPFHNFTYADEKIPFFPPHLPPFVLRLLRQGRIRQIPADALDSRWAYLLACRRSVRELERIYPVVRPKIAPLARCLTRLMGSEEAEFALRKHICRELARFFATDHLLARIDVFMSECRCVVHPFMNVSDYLEMREEVGRSGVRLSRWENIRLSGLRRVADGIGRRFKGAGCRLLIAGQMAGTAARHLFPRKAAPAKPRHFTHGFTIISPARQLSGTGRGPFFLMKAEYARSVVAIPLVPMNAKQKQTLAGYEMSARRLPGLVGFFRRPGDWIQLMGACLRIPTTVSAPVLVAGRCLLEYQRWKEFVEWVRMDHFVTHANFGVGAIARNIALNQSGCETWYFLDSVNAVVNYQDESTAKRAGHPNLPFLNYDNLVAWNEYIRDFYMSHPGPPKGCHVVGALWAGITPDENGVPESIRSGLEKARQKGLFVVGAFDSTYTRNGFTSYQEGIAFLDDLLQILEENASVFLVLKEKKDRGIHGRLDPDQGPRLLARLKILDRHPRALMVGATYSADYVKSRVDLVVSFPFTSTTAETLSRRRPAVWHDAKGCYRKTVWGKTEGLVTHSYAELASAIRAYESGRPATATADPRLIDPYCDGKAIERFRSLLFGEAA